MAFSSPSLKNVPRKPVVKEQFSDENDYGPGSAPVSVVTPSRAPLCPIPLPTQTSCARGSVSISPKRKLDAPTPQFKAKKLLKAHNFDVHTASTSENETLPALTTRNRFGWQPIGNPCSCNTERTSSSEAHKSVLFSGKIEQEDVACVELQTPPKQKRNLSCSDFSLLSLGSAGKDTVKTGHGVTSNYSTPQSSKSARLPSNEFDTSNRQIGTPDCSVFRSLKYNHPTTRGIGPLMSGGASCRLGTTGLRRQLSRTGHNTEYQPIDVLHFDLEEDPSFWREHNVQVLIRCRPLNASEIASHGCSRCLRQESSHTIAWIGQPESRFTFDHVACENITQEELFNTVGVPMVDNCMLGYNSCMFAYGQTGSGKTHTMLGDINDLEQQPSDNRGMTPRIFEYLFSCISREEKLRKHEHLKFVCKCSFLEIYNEQITDLLEPSSSGLHMREDVKKGVYVEDLHEVEVESLKDVVSLLLQGASNRRVSATNMNQESSRSHTVFTCIIESSWESESLTNIRFGRLNLVDLAGSERQKTSGAEGDRLKEAANINKSLSTLGMVIMILVDVTQGKQRHVPYRDSKLTFLLQDSLGGNSKTIIIANVSPSIFSAAETLSTLKFAQRAKFIQNNAIVNDNVSGDVSQLRMQIEHLKEELNRLRGQSISTKRVATIKDVTGVLRPTLYDYNKAEVAMDWEEHTVLEGNASLEKMGSLKATLAGCIRREQVAEYVAKQLREEIEQLNRLVKQREDDVQCRKMMLYFREDKIKRLEAMLHGQMVEGICRTEEEIALKEELLLLRNRMERNPEVTRFAMENIRLMTEIQRMQEFYGGGEREILLEEISTLRNQVLECLEGRISGESGSFMNTNAKDTMEALTASEQGTNCLRLTEENAASDHTKMRHTGLETEVSCQQQQSFSEVQLMIKKWGLQLPGRNLNSNKDMDGGLLDMHDKGHKTVEHLQMMIATLKQILMEEQAKRKESEERLVVLTDEVVQVNLRHCELSQKLHESYKGLDNSKVLIEALEGEGISSMERIKQLEAENLMIQAKLDKSECDVSILSGYVVFLQSELQPKLQSEMFEVEANEDKTCILMAKLQRMKRTLEHVQKLNIKLQFEQESVKAVDLEKDFVRADAEAETAHAITLFQSEILSLSGDHNVLKLPEEKAEKKAKQLTIDFEELQLKFNGLLDKNAQLSKLCTDSQCERDNQIFRLMQNWELASNDLIECLLEGNHALDAAVEEIKVLGEDCSSLGTADPVNGRKEILGKTLHAQLVHAQQLSKQVERKVRDLSDASFIMAENQQQENTVHREIELMRADIEEKSCYIGSLEREIKHWKLNVMELKKMALALLIAVDRFFVMCNNHENVQRTSFLEVDAVSFMPNKVNELRREQETLLHTGDDGAMISYNAPAMVLEEQIHKDHCREDAAACACIESLAILQGWSNIDDKIVLFVEVEVLKELLCYQDKFMKEERDVLASEAIELRVELESAILKLATEVKTSQIFRASLHGMESKLSDNEVELYSISTEIARMTGEMEQLQLLLARKENENIMLLSRMESMIKIAKRLFHICENRSLMSCQDHIHVLEAEIYSIQNAVSELQQHMTIHFSMEQQLELQATYLQNDCAKQERNVKCLSEELSLSLRNISELEACTTKTKNALLSAELTIADLKNQLVDKLSHEVNILGKYTDLESDYGGLIKKMQEAQQKVVQLESDNICLQERVKKKNDAIMELQKELKLCRRQISYLLSMWKHFEADLTGKESLLYKESEDVQKLCLNFFSLETKKLAVLKEMEKQNTSSRQIQKMFTKGHARLFEDFNTAAEYWISEVTSVLVDAELCLHLSGDEICYQKDTHASAMVLINEQEPWIGKLRSLMPSSGGFFHGLLRNIETGILKDITEDWVKQRVLGLFENEVLQQIWNSQVEFLEESFKVHETAICSLKEESNRFYEENIQLWTELSIAKSFILELQVQLIHCREEMQVLHSQLVLVGMADLKDGISKLWARYEKRHESLEVLQMAQMHCEDKLQVGGHLAKQSRYKFSELPEIFDIERGLLEEGVYIHVLDMEITREMHLHYEMVKKEQFILIKSLERSLQECNKQQAFLESENCILRGQVDCLAKSKIHNDILTERLQSDLQSSREKIDEVTCKNQQLVEEITRYSSLSPKFCDDPYTTSIQNGDVKSSDGKYRYSERKLEWLEGCRSVFPMEQCILCDLQQVEFEAFQSDVKELVLIQSQISHLFQDCMQLLRTSKWYMEEAYSRIFEMKAEQTLMLELVEQQWIDLFSLTERCGRMLLQKNCIDSSLLCKSIQDEACPEDMEVKGMNAKLKKVDDQVKLWLEILDQIELTDVAITELKKSHQELFLDDSMDHTSDDHYDLISCRLKLVFVIMKSLDSGIAELRAEVARKDEGMEILRHELKQKSDIVAEMKVACLGMSETLHEKESEVAKYVETIRCLSSKQCQYEQEVVLLKAYKDSIGCAITVQDTVRAFLETLYEEHSILAQRVDMFEHRIITLYNNLSYLLSSEGLEAHIKTSFQIKYFSLKFEEYIEMYTSLPLSCLKAVEIPKAMEASSKLPVKEWRLNDRFDVLNACHSLKGALEASKNVNFLPLEEGEFKLASLQKKIDEMGNLMSQQDIRNTCMDAYQNLFSEIEHELQVCQGLILLETQNAELAWKTVEEVLMEKQKLKHELERKGALVMELQNEVSALQVYMSKSCETASSELRKQVSLLEVERRQLDEQVEVAVQTESIVDEWGKKDAELFKAHSSIQQKVSISLDRAHSNGAMLANEFDRLHAQMAVLKEQLEIAQELTKLHEADALEAHQIAEAIKIHAEHKEEEMQLLEKAVEELESTVNTLEAQVDVLRMDAEQESLRKEEIEIELDALKSQMRQMVVLQLEHKIEEGAQREKERTCEAKDVQCLEHTVSMLKCQCQGQQLKERREHIDELIASAHKQSLEYHQQMTLEMDEELMVARERIAELEASFLSKEKEVFILNTRLAEAEGMTHDVIRELLGVKLDITKYASFLRLKRLQDTAEGAQLMAAEAKERQEIEVLKERLAKLVEERESWLEEITRRQAEMMTARVASEKLRQRDHLLSVENETLKIENSNQRQKLLELEEEINKLSGQQNLQQRIHHHAKIKEENNCLRMKSEDLAAKLQRMEMVLNHVNKELAAYRSADGKTPYIDFEEEQRVKLQLESVEEEKFQAAQKLLSLCTSIIQAAGVVPPAGEIDHVVAANALKILQGRLEAAERELSDIKLKKKIDSEKQKLSKLRSAQSPDWHKSVM